MRWDDLTSVRITETVGDPDSDFVLMNLRIGDLDVRGPIKTVDAKFVTRQLLEKEKDGFQKILLETSKTIGQGTIDNLLEETRDWKVKSAFGFRDWFSTYPNIITLTFDFNPYLAYGKIDRISGFFDYYHNYSDTAVFVPNVKVKKRVFRQTAGKTRKIEIKKRIDLKGYKRFVDEVHQVLDFRNKKPIFVPIPLEFGMEGVREVAEHYVKMEYFNVWADFQSKPTTDRTRRSLIRQFRRIFEQNERLDDLIIHSTNLRREIRPHSKESLSPSSDVLASVIGSSLVGVNRNPPAPPSGNGPKLTYKERLELWMHKARVFDPTSYYYIRAVGMDVEESRKEELMRKNCNILHNSRLLNQELEVQKERLLEDASIKEYVSNKPMVKEYRNGELVGVLFGREKTIDEYF